MTDMPKPEEASEAEKTEPNENEEPAEEEDLATKDTVDFRYSMPEQIEKLAELPSDAPFYTPGSYKPGMSFMTGAPAGKPAEPEQETVETYDGLQGDPTDFFGWAMRSYSLMRSGDKEGAWNCARKALEIGTKEPDLFVPLCQQFEPAQRRQLANDAMMVTPPDHAAFQWLWVEVALSYWYEGNFAEACAEYETILKQKNIDHGLMGVLINGWAMCLEANNEYGKAEAKYLEAGNSEAAVRARLRSGDAEGALKLMQENGLGPKEPEIRAALEGTILCLLGRRPQDLEKRIKDLKDIDDDWIYKDFMLGSMQVVAQQFEEGEANLSRFLTICERNPGEWGVTLRWEKGVAQEVLRMLSEMTFEE